MGFRQPSYLQPGGSKDNDDAEDAILPDALDIDEIGDDEIRDAMKGQGRAAQVADLPDPEFELIRQAYPNRPRPWRPC